MAGCDGTAHLAAPGGWHADDAAGLEDVIVNGARNVLEAASALPGHRVLLVSSTAAINASDGPTVFDERAEFNVKNPQLHYAHAKHKAELVAREAFSRGVAVIVVNPAEVYGPGDTALGTSANLIDFAKAIPVLVCDGGTSVVHVDDVARGIVAGLERGRPGERYILGGENITIRRMAELTLELTGRHMPIVPVPNGISRFVASAAIRLHVPVPFNPHVVPYATLYWFVDSGKAKRELGVTFRDGRATISSTIDWLRAQGMLR
jgi:dihydroflavonol-4-reductase